MLSREEFLQSLRNEAGRTLSEVEAEALIREAADHLDAAVQARLELGMSMDEAEREAVAMFGHPSVATPAESRHRDARRIRLGTIFLTLAVLSFVPPAVPWSFAIKPGLVLFLVARYAQACWLIRQPARLSIATAAFVGLFVPTMYVVGLSNGGFGHACRQLLYEWPKTDLANLGWFHPDWRWIPYFQKAVESGYEWRFLIGALLFGTLGVDFLAGTAGALSAELRRRRERALRV